MANRKSLEEIAIVPFYERSFVDRQSSMGFSLNSRDAKIVELKTDLYDSFLLVCCGELSIIASEIAPKFKQKIHSIVEWSDSIRGEFSNLVVPASRPALESFFSSVCFSGKELRSENQIRVD